MNIPFPLTYVITVLFMGVFGIVFQRIAYYPLRNRTFLPVVISTIGVSIFLKNGGPDRLRRRAVFDAAADPAGRC